MTTPGTESSRVAATQELASLEITEREISDRRAELHRQIDTVYLRAPLGPEDVVLLDHLEDLERVTSSERRELHARIDELRDQVGRNPGSTRDAA